MLRIETLAKVISGAVMSVATAIVKGATELPILEDNSSIIDKAKIREREVSGVRRMRDREEEKEEEKEGGE